jgi:hypothetical protein
MVRETGILNNSQTPVGKENNYYVLLPETPGG